MTSLEIQKAKKTLPPIKDWQNWTRKQKRLDEELSCREMIIWCMVYWESDFYNRKKDTFDGRYAMRFIKSLGEKTVRRLWKEQEETMKKATVHHGAYRDSEGGVYASVEW